MLLLLGDAPPLIARSSCCKLLVRIASNSTALESANLTTGAGIELEFELADLRVSGHCCFGRGSRGSSAYGWSTR